MTAHRRRIAIIVVGIVAISSIGLAVAIAAPFDSNTAEPQTDRGPLQAASTSRDTSATTGGAIDVDASASDAAKAAGLPATSLSVDAVPDHENDLQTQITSAAADSGPEGVSIASLKGWAAVGRLRDAVALAGVPQRVTGFKMTIEKPDGTTDPAYADTGRFDHLAAAQVFEGDSWNDDQVAANIGAMVKASPAGATLDRLEVIHSSGPAPLMWLTAKDPDMLYRDGLFKFGTFGDYCLIVKDASTGADVYNICRSERLARALGWVKPGSGLG